MDLGVIAPCPDGDRFAFEVRHRERSWMHLALTLLQVRAFFPSVSGTITEDPCTGCVAPQSARILLNPNVIPTYVTPIHGHLLLLRLPSKHRKSARRVRRLAHRSPPQHSLLLRSMVSV
jgi:hypothetical protein